MKPTFGIPIPNLSIAGRMLTNANGDIAVGSAGYQYLIDTLSEIRAGVVEQKFYKIAPADYMPVDVGYAAWADEIVQNLTFQTGGDFFEGDIDTNYDTSRMAHVDTALAPIRMPVNTWAKQVTWTIADIAKAARTNWDIVEGKMKSLKTDWDLGIQKVAFLGHPVEATMTGLLTDSEVNINTVLISVPISDMSETQFKALVAGILDAYWTNSNNTEAEPDTFVIPTSDYLGLVGPVSGTFPIISKIEYLQNALEKATRNPGFKILPLAYAQSDRNSGSAVGGKNRYTLYKREPETLQMTLPVDFTMNQAATANNFNWEQNGYGQYSGCLINRKREVLYLDETAT